MMVIMPDSRCASRRRRCAGFTLSEILLVMIFIGLIAGIGATAWTKSRARMNTSNAARLTKVFMHRARMQAIYRGVNHFVMVDPEAGTLSIIADTGATSGELDAADERVATTALANGVDLTLPASGSLPSPEGSGTISAAWSMPVPSVGDWSGQQRGVMVNPRGTFQSAESTPQTISAGTIVFSTPTGTSAVSLRGSLGAVRSFEYLEGHWSEM